jgi:hypothetical protein
VAVGLGSKVLVLGGIQFEQFPAADLFALETDPGYVSELIRLEDAVVDKERRRINQMASVESSTRG